MENFNGAVTKQDPDGYLMKVNVYGYSDAMLNQLNDYNVAGKIDPESLKKGNSIVLKTITDGQGNIDGIALKPGDTIKLKVPKTMSDPELLKFQGDQTDYIEKEFTIAAIVNRPLAKNNFFIGDDKANDTIDIIMPCSVMQQSYYDNGYNQISINLHKKTDSYNITKQIRSY